MKPGELTQAIARQVRDLRKQRKWTQHDLARASGRHQTTISRIEHAGPDDKTTVQTLESIARALGCKVKVEFLE